MIYKIVFLSLVAACYVLAAPTAVVPLEKQQPTVIPIISQSEELEPNGTYKFSYETGNGIKREEVSYDKVIPKAAGRKASSSEEGGESDESGDSDEIHVQRGSYSYTAPDGTIITLSYIADENGFQPIGSHLPRAPTPVPVSPASNEKTGRALKTPDNSESASVQLPSVKASEDKPKASENIPTDSSAQVVEQQEQPKDSEKSGENAIAGDSATSPTQQLDAQPKSAETTVSGEPGQKVETTENAATPQAEVKSESAEASAPLQSNDKPAPTETGSQPISEPSSDQPQQQPQSDENSQVGVTTGQNDSQEIAETTPGSAVPKSDIAEVQTTASQSSEKSDINEASSETTPEAISTESPAQPEAVSTTELNELENNAATTETSAETESGIQSDTTESVVTDSPQTSEKSNVTEAVSVTTDAVATEAGSTQTVAQSEEDSTTSQSNAEEKAATTEASISTEAELKSETTESADQTIPASDVTEAGSGAEPKTSEDNSLSDEKSSESTTQAASNEQTTGSSESVETTSGASDEKATEPSSEETTIAVAVAGDTTASAESSVTASDAAAVDEATTANTDVTTKAAEDIPQAVSEPATSAAPTSEEHLTINNGYTQKDGVLTNYGILYIDENVKNVIYQCVNSMNKL